MKQTSRYFSLVTILLLICGCSTMKQVSETTKQALESDSSLTEEEVVAGLKEALEVGTEKAVENASRKNGFLENNEIRIPFPPEAENVKKKALQLGLDRQVKRFETTLNRAAEKATAKAIPVFVNAIKNMTIREGFDILNGSDTAATTYLKQHTSSTLRDKFRPIVEKATDQVELTNYWKPIIKKYNTATVLTGGENVNPDLDGYVTKKAMEGLFHLIAKEEREIRERPVARTTELLKKVFGSE